MRKFTVIFFGIFVTLLILGVAIAVSAQGETGGMYSWYDECGYTCYQWADGSGDCYLCQESEDCNERGTPTPVSTPTPRIDPTPEKTKKPKCNSGGGNGSEGSPDCDPGNSGENNQAGD